MSPAIGDPAPDFERFTSDGRRVSLQALRGRRVVLFFYPRDDTAVCTREACSFRDQGQAFAEIGAEILAISADDDESHRRFAAKHRLRYGLIADTDRSLRRLFGVKRFLGLLDGRETFVIDERGVIRNIIRAQLSAETHLKGALQTLRALPEWSAKLA